MKKLLTKQISNKLAVIITSALFLIPLFAIAHGITGGSFSSNLIGTVKDYKTGQAVKHATVILVNLKTNRRLTHYTNDKGNYHFQGLRSDGLYQVYCGNSKGEMQLKFPADEIPLNQTARRNCILNTPDNFKAKVWFWKQDKATRL